MRRASHAMSASTTSSRSSRNASTVPTSRRCFSRSSVGGLAGARPAQILERYQSDRFVRPSSVAPEALDAIIASAIAALPHGFERLELSPVCPLGTSSVLGGISQDRVVATARGTEVVSDPTNVLALECAVRRRADRTTP